MQVVVAAVDIVVLFRLLAVAWVEVVQELK
jgi:hypothetical protein